MHSVLQRLNVIGTYALSLMIALLAATAASEYFHVANPSVAFRLARVERLARHGDKNWGIEEAALVYELDADLRSCFGWNTKQLFVYAEASYWSKNMVNGGGGNLHNTVVIWDKIITSKEDAAFSLKEGKHKYRLYDREGDSLKGNEVNVTVAWNVMPVVGKLYYDKRDFLGFKLPDEYL